MYADRHAGFSLDSRSLTVALALNGAAVAALLFASPEIIATIKDRPLITENIPLKPPPPPEKPQPKVKTRPSTVIDIPKPFVEHPQPTEIDIVTKPEQPTDLTDLGTGPVDGSVIKPVDPPALPVLIGASVDPRFADALQPPYPSEEKRAEHEGRVVVRVLIGVDGRVKQVARVSATTDSFFRVTERQALSRWRFRPATRDGVPVEAWREMAVRFELSTDS